MNHTVISNKLHIGCGLNTPDGWINLDGSWNARLAKYPIIRKFIQKFGLISKTKLDIPWDSDIFIHNVKKKLPFPDNNFLAIYSSHLLEHLYLKEARFLLRECFRILQPGGVLRIVVPDLQSIALRYVETKTTSSLHNQPEG